MEQYKRDLNHHYLVFPCREEEQDYRISMLCYQKTEELLPCTARRIDGELLLAYDISGLQSMEQVFGKRPMEAEDLRELLQTLSQTAERIKEYLLDAELLVLDPAYIFLTGEGRYRFCCFPDSEETVFVRMHRLGEFILNILDHKDEGAVQLGYCLYRNTMQENFSLEQILSGEIVLPEKKKRENRISEEPAESVHLPREASEEKTPKASGKIFPSGIKRRGLFKHKQEYRKKERIPFYAKEELFSCGEGTCMLQGVNYPELTFSPAGFPFLLGSLESGVDGYVDVEGVSRFHARIDQEDGIYYVTDLGSASGTFVNQERLMPESPRAVTVGDIIRLGQVNFAFLHKNNGK